MGLPESTEQEPGADRAERCRNDNASGADGTRTHDPLHAMRIETHRVVHLGPLKFVKSPGRAMCNGSVCLCGSALFGAVQMVNGYQDGYPLPLAWGLARSVGELLTACASVEPIVLSAEVRRSWDCVSRADRRHCLGLPRPAGRRIGTFRRSSNRHSPVEPLDDWPSPKAREQGADRSTRRLRRLRGVMSRQKLVRIGTD